MNNNFTELTNDELLNIDGGANWLKVTGGVLLCAGSIAGGMTGAGIPGSVVGFIGGVGCIVDGL